MSVLRLLLAGAVFLIAGAAWADTQKLALIITNQDYPASIGALENPHRDGESMTAALS